MNEYHIPVLVEEVIEGLRVEPGRWYIDATVGGGGHSLAILNAGGNVMGIDQDDDALEASRHRFESEKIANDRFELIKGNFRDLALLVGSTDKQFHGILFDLGVSSHQFDELERGFSFESPNLDMRMDPTAGVPAEQLVNVVSEADLVKLLTDWGEEPLARRYAKAIATARKAKAIKSGRQLAEIIWQASPVNVRHGKIHPATRTFQALRLAVNDELTSLSEVLPQAVDILPPAGRMAVISFHSLEDRIVKRFFADNPELVVVSKEPIVAKSAEVESNPRSRSAKLRVAVKK